MYFAVVEVKKCPEVFVTCPYQVKELSTESWYNNSQFSVNIYFGFTQPQKCVEWFFLATFAKEWLWNVDTFCPEAASAGLHGLQSGCGEKDTKRKTQEIFYYDQF